MEIDCVAELWEITEKWKAGLLSDNQAYSCAIALGMLDASQKMQHEANPLLEMMRKDGLAN